MKQKGTLHPRNPHNGRYDLPKLAAAHPPLSKYIAVNEYGDESINFFDTNAVRALNEALLAHYYAITAWRLPAGALIPPIPGRADYIHYLADLVGKKQGVHCLDIGVGANCIYPIIGAGSYGWSFVGSDISPRSIDNAKWIVKNNKQLAGRVELRHQADRDSIFKGIIMPDDHFDVTLCNPPFHESAESAAAGSLRKVRALKGRRVASAKLNFAGADNELWCEGGELQFIRRMICESADFRRSCVWFTTLVSKEDNLPKLRGELQRAGVSEQRTIEMSQGNKRSRILAWRY